MTDTVLQRLLKYPHQAVFDLSPNEELAFRLTHANGARWEVGPTSFTATAGVTVYTHELAGITVAELATLLRADGFFVDSQNSFFSWMSASVLVPGSGDQYQSNGDRVFGYTSLLWVLLTGYANVVGAAERGVVDALLQMFLPTAEGEWIDLWGALYGVLRMPDETDSHYRDRIPREAFRVRVNAHAIEAAIFDEAGYDVRILEPWVDIFTLDDSLLSGPHKMYDGERVGYHLIQPVAYQVFDWGPVLAIIERNRPAGVLVLTPRLEYRIEVDAGIGSDASEAFVTLRVDADVLVEDVARLDFMSLDDDVSLPNEKFLIRSIVQYAYEADGPATYDVETLVRGDHSIYQFEPVYVGQRWDQVRIAWVDLRDDTWGGLTVISETSVT